MLPGYHYMEVYHLFYAVNQWLASQGYVVLSVNYRGGIGYGKSFRTAPNAMSQATRDHYARRIYFRFVPDERILSWDNRKLGLA